MKAILYILLLTFSWQAGGFGNYAYAFDRAPARQDAADSPWVQLNGLVERLEKALAQALTALEANGTASAALDDLDAVRVEIEALDARIGDALAAAEDRLREADDSVHARHRRLVAAYTRQRDLILSRLADIRDAADAEQRRERVANLLDLLSQRQRARRVRPMTPDTLPHRSPQVEPRAPRTEPLRSRGLLDRLPAEGIKVAALGSVAMLLAQNDGPAAGDLAPNDVDVVITDEITALAASLGHDPVKIYEYVRNEFTFEPTWGSIKGAQGTLWAKAGNAFDQASLLVALLRASGIPAKYEFVTIDVPVATAMNWVGASDPQAASSVFSSGGIPAVAFLDQNDEVTKVQMEHVLVRAWVDYTPSRGAVTQEGDRWIRLDPAFKELEEVPGINFEQSLSLDAEALWTRLMAGSQQGDYHVTGVDPANVQSEIADYRSTLSAQVQASPPEVLRELVGMNLTIKKEYGILPPTKRYDIVTVLDEFAEIPDNLRHRVQFVLEDVDQFGFTSQVFSHTAWMPLLAGRRITLSYAPADQATENYLTSLLPAPLPGETPNDTAARMPAVLDATRIVLRDELKIAGQTVASRASGSIGIGYDQRFTMNILTPGGFANGNVVNDIVAGAFQAVVLNLGAISSEYLDGRRQILEGFAEQIRPQNGDPTSGDPTGITKDDFFGEVLHLAGVKYWLEMSVFEKVAQRMTGVTATRLPTEGIFSHNLGVVYGGFFGDTPVEIRSGGLGTDIDHDLQAVISNDLDPERARQYLLMTGILGSYMEGSVYDQLLSELDDNGEGLSFTGVSTAHILGYANAQGIPIYHIDSTNLAEVLPRLQMASNVKTAISNAVNSGMVVTVPEREMTLEGGWWTGVGYAAIDPNTGAGGFIISGGTAGGGFDLDFLRNPLVSFILGALLIGAGIFAAGLAAVLLAVIGIAIIGYQLAADIADIQNNPDYTDADREMLIGFYVMLAVIGALLAVAGIFFGPLGAFVAIALYYLYISIMATLIMGTLAPLMARRRNQLDDILNGSSLERIFDWIPRWRKRALAALEPGAPPLSLASG